MPVRLNGSTSGYTELDAGAVAGNNTLKMPTSNGAAYQVLRNGATPGTMEFGGAIVSGTAQASTSGTSIDFTGIPSWVKRVTVMFNGVSTNGSSAYQVQIGSTSFSTSGYWSTSCFIQGASVGGASITSGMRIANNAATDFLYGAMVFTLVSGNTWISTHAAGIDATADLAVYGSGTVTLSGTLDRIRITTVNGTDAFDAGTINILYE